MCSGAMFVAVNLLARPELQQLVRMIYALLGPLYDSHSAHARDARSPEGALSYYVEQSRERFLDTLKTTFSLLGDLKTLGFVGFTTSFDHLKRATLPRHEEQLADEDEQAGQAWALVVGLVRHRCASMAWHSRSWPGRLALFASPSLAERKKALTWLREDWAAFNRASEYAEASDVVGKLVKQSPFQTVAVREVAEVADETRGATEEEVLDELKDYASAVFSGWGHSKIIEDALQRLRDREQRDTPNRRLDRVKQWSVLRDKNVIDLHKRVEQAPDEGILDDAPKLPNRLFSYVNQPVSIDATSLTQRATWPTFSAQSSQTLPSDAALLAHCHREDCWESAPGVAKTIFVPQGCVVAKPGSDEHVVCCGLVGGWAHIAWPLERVVAKSGEVWFKMREGADVSFQYLYLLDWDTYTVVPTEAVCPGRQYALEGFRLSKKMGVSIRQSGPPCSVLKHAARHAFWALSKATLDFACHDLGLKPRENSLYASVESLVRHELKDLSDAAILDIIAKRGSAPPQRIPADISAEVVEDLVGSSEAEMFKDVQQLLFMCAQFVIYRDVSPFSHRHFVHIFHIVILSTFPFRHPQEAKEDINKKRADAAEWRTQHAAAVEAAPGKAAGGDAGAAAGAAASDAPKIKAIKFPAKLDLGHAKVYKPARSSVWHETQSDRIRVSYTSAAEKVSTSWPAAPSAHDSIMKCLRWAWQQHKDAGGAPAPWKQLQ